MADTIQRKSNRELFANSSKSSRFSQNLSFFFKPHRSIVPPETQTARSKNAPDRTVFMPKYSKKPYIAIKKQPWRFMSKLFYISEKQNADRLISWENIYLRSKPETVILIELPFFFISPPTMKKPLCSAVLGLFSHDYIEKEMPRRNKLSSKHLLLSFRGKSNRVQIGNRVQISKRVKVGFL